MKTMTLAVRMIKEMVMMITAKLNNKAQAKYSRPKITMIQFAVMMIFLTALSSLIVKKSAIQKTT